MFCVVSRRVGPALRACWLASLAGRPWVGRAGGCAERAHLYLFLFEPANEKLTHVYGGVTRKEEPRMGMFIFSLKGTWREHGGAAGRGWAGAGGCGWGQGGGTMKNET